VETELNIGVTARIPESYIADGRERLRWYKALSSAPDTATRQDRELELRDRFGPLPLEVRVFLAVLALKQQLTSLQAVRADVHAEKLRIAWEAGQTAVSGHDLARFVQNRAHQARLTPPGTLELRLDAVLPLPERLAQAQNLLHALTAESA